MKSLVAAAVAGVVFSLGLGLGGMTDPRKVVGFLDVAGSWDPSLMFVMMGALGVHIPLRLLLLRRQKPLFADAFLVPPRSSVRPRLVVGSAIFGIGWGLGGYCPGPGFTSAATGGGSAVLFVVSMLGGMILYQLWNRATSSEAATVPVPVEESRVG